MDTPNKFNLQGSKYPHAYGYGYLTALIDFVEYNARMAKEFPDSADFYLDEIIKAKEVMLELKKAVDSASGNLNAQ
jgi:hypothetical protein